MSSLYRCFNVFFINLASLTKIYSISPLSSVRGSMGFAVVGEKAYFGGGYNGTNCMSTVVVYDSSSGLWSTLSSMLSVARSKLVAISIDLIVIFYGGTLSSGATSNVVDIYNTYTMAFSSSSLSSGRKLVAYGAIGNRLAFFATGHDGSTTSNVVNIFNYTSKSWVSTTVSQSRQAATGLGFRSKFYCVGGISTSDGGYTTVNIYNDDTSSWSIAAISSGRGYIAAVNVGPILLFAGGFASGSAFSLVDVFDSTSNIWTTTAMSVSRWFFSGITIGCKVIFPGGRNSGNAELSSVDIYDSSSRIWSTLANLGYATSDYGSVTVGSIALIVGGTTTAKATFYSVSCLAGMIYFQ